MKKTALAIVALTVMMLAGQEVSTHVGGVSATYSGGAGEKNCTWCHTGTLGSGPGTVSLTCDAPSNMYIPGDTYTFTATVTESGLVRYGFEVLMGYSATGNRSDGTILHISSTETQTKSSGTRRYVTHKLASTSGSGSRSWNFKWIAPNPGTGPLTFYAGFNGANNNNAKTGDHIYLANLTLDQLVGVEEEVAATAPVTLYPTLVQDALHLTWPKTTGAIVTAEVFNLQGQFVFRHDFPGIAEQGMLDATSWTSGTYLIRVKVGDNVTSHKVIKL
jgi:hypothetical protein